MFFDESILRKAASWQDFKEAQSLLGIGAVTRAEKLETGWQGCVRVGTRTFHPSVIAKSPTWFDTKCSCPANQRQGSFCSHAIATGLYLLSPPVSVPNRELDSSESSIPALSWQIRFQGPWQKSIGRGHAAVALSPSDHPPTSADSRLTAWLLSQKARPEKILNLLLNPITLSDFLNQIENHPDISAENSRLTIESGAQIHIQDCTCDNQTIHLTPSSQTIIGIADSFWEITATGLTRIGTAPIPSLLRPYIETLCETKATALPLDTFLSLLDSLQTL
ncbi:MAG: SWIM zinc finger family protein, partial [Armatimonadetes bacterium]|nr:SWIM zinc finger family protein [Akkermansiaceae bacterium]